MRSTSTSPAATLAALIALGALGGCASEVDKCVDAQVTAWKAEQDRLRAEVASGRREAATSTSELGRVLEVVQGKVAPDTRTRDEVAAQARLQCMRAAGADRPAGAR